MVLITLPTGRSSICGCDGDDGRGGRREDQDHVFGRATITACERTDCRAQRRATERAAYVARAHTQEAGQQQDLKCYMSRLRWNCYERRLGRVAPMAAQLCLGIMTVAPRPSPTCLSPIDESAARMKRHGGQGDERRTFEIRAVWKTRHFRTVPPLGILNRLNRGEQKYE